MKKMILLLGMCLSFYVHALDEGLKVTEKAEYFVRFNLEGPEFLKDKNLTYMIKYKSGDTTCYSIDVDKKLGFHLHGKDGLDIVGQLELKKDLIELASTKTTVNGMVMPKSANTKINLSSEYHLFRFSEKNPNYKKDSYIFNLEVGSGKEFEFLFTQCSSDKTCSRHCL